MDVVTRQPVAIDEHLLRRRRIEPDNFSDGGAREHEDIAGGKGARAGVGFAHGDRRSRGRERKCSADAHGEKGDTSADRIG